MDENNDKMPIDLIDIAQKVWKARKRVLLYVLIGAFVGLTIALCMPNSYRAFTIVAPEGTKNPRNSSMGALAGVLGMNLTGTDKEGINENLYPVIFKSSPFLLEFAEMKVEYKKDSIYFYDYILEHQKYPWWHYVIKSPSLLMKLFRSPKDEQFESSKALQARYVGLLSQKVKVDNIKDEGILEISANMQDPVIAYQLAEKLLRTLQQYITDYRTCKVRDDLNMTQLMLEQAQNNYYRSDSIFAQMVDRNQNLISKSAKIKLERYSNERNLAFNIYQELGSKVETTKVKLQEQTPIATVIEPVNTPFEPSSPNIRLFIILYAFLGASVYISILIAKELIK